MAEKNLKTASSARNKEGDLNLKNTILILLLFALLCGFAWYFYAYKKAQKEISYLTEQMQVNQMSKEEVDQLLEEVSKLMILPEDQGEPMIATIKDVELLKKNEPFYVNAQNGDKLIIYQDRAIIYSPARHKIVNVGPVYLQSDDNQEAVLRLDVRNGSRTTGLASQKAEELGQLREFEIADIKTAVNTDYEGIILVNLSGKNVSALENILGVKAVTTLPAGEQPSSADVIVILGN